MNLSSKVMRPAVLVTTLTAVVTLSGCASHGAAPRTVQADSDTVDICVTRATHTRCSRHSASDYAENRISYRMELPQDVAPPEEW